MIARIWRGAVRLHDGDPYAQYMGSTGMPEYRSTPGNVAALMLRRDLDDTCEFLMISLWDSMDSIKGFAGDEPEQAVFYPEDDHFLIERDLVVKHYVVDSATDATCMLMTDISRWEDRDGRVVET